MKVNRQTVDLSQYPDLVVIYLGMRVNRFAGIKTLLGIGPNIASSVAARPEGLLRHEDFVFSLFPATRWHASVLAGHGLAARLDAVRSSSRMVEEVPARFGRHRLLARDLPDEGRNGRHLRRCASSDRLHGLCTHRSRPRTDVQRFAQGGARPDAPPPPVSTERDLYGS